MRLRERESERVIVCSSEAGDGSVAAVFNWATYKTKSWVEN